MTRGFLYHLWLTLRLNFASTQALVYGYLVPVFFLVAFGTVFRSGHPALAHQMSQLLTITILGGACFGMPTALVAERERGWWRRYKLLPGALVPLVASTLIARFVLVASGGALQLVLARLLYGTPLPGHPLHFAAAYGAAAGAFLGLGLLVAALVRDVPAVQALGQCIFLPLIMVGGVGVPLAVLPEWAQRIAAFLPGRYAVDALQAGFTDEGHGAVFRFNLIVLGVIGAAAGCAGAKCFRWDSAGRIGRAAAAWVALALVPWVAVGLFSLGTGRWHPLGGVPSDPSLAVTEAQIDGIRYTGLPADDGVVTPLAPAVQDLDSEERERLDALKARLEAWPPGRDGNPSQAIRNLLCVAAVADVGEDPLEGGIARTVLEHLYGHFRQDALERGLAWIALDPNGGSVRTAVPELQIPGEFDAATIRSRDAIYAVKFLGRVRGRLNN